MSPKESSQYSAKDIFVLQGLEAVRKRPAMYIGSTDLEGLHHLLKEVVSNAVDEAIMGYCNHIEVVLHKDGSVEVADNGRGIPVDIHPQTKKSALETVVTHLHAGAKFGGKMYVTAGGLHGVGISVVCALSEKMKVTVFRDGYVWEQEYSRGKAITKLQKKGKTDRTGTVVWFKPDPKIFPKTEFQEKRIVPYLREQAFLTPALQITFRNLQTGKERVFYFENSIFAYLRYLILGQKRKQENIFLGKGEKDNIKVEVAFCYIEDLDSQELSFANNINTTEGGTHLTGFRTALTRVINTWGKEQGLLKESNSLTYQDLKTGLRAIVSVKIPEPLFEGQTKRKLTNPEARQVVYDIVSEKLREFLARYPKDGKEIISLGLLSQKARKAAKSARESVIKKGISRSLVLSGKLADCTSRDPAKCELFIVEGDSAGGSGKQARDRRFQAILPLRGKILNVEKATLDRIMQSKEIKDLIVAMGGGVGEGFDIRKLRYHKIIIMTDADSDGNHIKTLLLTLFWRYFRPVIEEGYLYVARPPLYRIEAGKEVYYVFDDKEKDSKLKELEKKGIKNIRIQRFKGLGEMNPEQLWETTMDPARRHLYKVTVKDAQEAERLFSILMGEEVEPRKKFIQSRAQTAILDI